MGHGSLRERREGATGVLVLSLYSFTCSLIFFPQNVYTFLCREVAHFRTILFSDSS